MAASVPAAQNGSGSVSARPSKRNPPGRSFLHVTDLPIKKRIQLINQEAAEIRTETKRIQLTNQEPAETERVCDICNRPFASSRSVAIHRGHHIRRDRARMQEQVAAENPNSRMSDLWPVAARRRRQSNGPGSVHQCRRCWRIFVSGQALGAHKRHCTWPPMEQEIVNNFDLNEVPPPEEEDSLAIPWHY
ncbi:hypothetical protein F511_05745 [Dorcoceras hygrometricum]|uniref:C2H2-type domain-containing protein n=1 Tax=Dorcoceras hygrometricum TaxID=472368 RepID=A0A2Z7B7Z3_9LAMI|nr:hypothetical protein F511_05745 [Dorcoceras hygrometricum]